jgi:hypothetical protein
MTTSPADTARAYAEARISTLNQAIAPLMEEKHAWQRVLQFLPTTGVSPALQGRLETLAQQDPALRTHLQPLLNHPKAEAPTETSVETAISLTTFLTSYRQEMYEAMPNEFSRQDLLDWVRAHKDDYSTSPGAQVSRVGDALWAFKRYNLVRDYQGVYTKGRWAP